MQDRQAEFEFSLLNNWVSKTYFYDCRKNCLKLEEISRSGERLKGMKQGSLAEELEISIVALSNIETGKTNIPLIRLFAIASVLEIPVEFLFTDPHLIISEVKKQKANTPRL